MKYWWRMNRNWVRDLPFHPFVWYVLAKLMLVALILVRGKR